MQQDLLNLLQAVAEQSLTPEAALAQIKYLEFETVGDYAMVDHHRSLRTGFPEVVFGASKTPEQIVQIMRSLLRHSPNVMATRITPEIYGQIQPQLRELQYFPIARIGFLGEIVKQAGKMAIVAAGTSDIPVAEEAAITAELAGFTVTRLWDVGVAGIHRLLAHRHLLREAEVIITVAGMEGAIASVVGGLVDVPVIAVPTSVGYGASFNGLAPLLGMLNSCAAGVGVVNIDNGFGAATLAGQILRLVHRINY